MTEIKLLASDETLAIMENPVITSGDVNAVSLNVIFSDDWDGLGKSATFSTEKNKELYEVVLSDGVCMVPSEVLSDEGKLYIGVRGVSDDGTIKTSSIITYKILKGTQKGTHIPVKPTADVYGQILGAYGELDLRLNEESKLINDLALDLATEISDRSAEIAIERKRIDNITKLPSGSTTADAELMDIRVGADKKTYPTAGDAVRSQIKDLSSDIKVNYDLNSFRNNSKGEYHINVFAQGGYNSSTGEEFNSSKYIRTAKIPMDAKNNVIAFHSSSSNVLSIQPIFWDQNKKMLGKMANFNSNVEKIFYFKQSESLINTAYISFTIGLDDKTDITPDSTDLDIVCRCLTFEKGCKLDNAILNVSNTIKREYINYTTGNIAVDGSYTRSKKLYEIEEDTFYKTNNTSNIYLLCFDDDLNYLGYVRPFSSSYINAKKTPKKSKWCYININSSDIDTIQLEKIDGSSISTICYPYLDQNYILWENKSLSNKGVINNNVNYNLICIPNIKGEKIYTSYNVLNNVVFYDEKNTIVGDGSSYESCTPVGRIYTIPSEAVKVFFNIPTRVDAVMNESIDYIKVLKTGYKKMAVIGDSITYLDGRNYGGSTSMVGYQGQLRKAFNAIVDNYGYTSRPYTEYTTSNSSETDSEVIQDSIYNKIVTEAVDMSGYDVAILFGGANDVRLSLPIGNYSTDYNSPNYDSHTFNGAIGGIVKYLRESNPNIIIILCTTLPSESTTRGYLHNKEYRDAIIKNAEFYSVPCLDLFTAVNIMPKSNFSEYMYDTAHPNIKGMKRIGKIMVNFIKNYI